MYIYMDGYSRWNLEGVAKWWRFKFSPTHSPLLLVEQRGRNHKHTRGWGGRGARIIPIQASLCTLYLCSVVSETKPEIDTKNSPVVLPSKNIPEMLLIHPLREHIVFLLEHPLPSVTPPYPWFPPKFFRILRKQFCPTSTSSLALPRSRFLARPFGSVAGWGVMVYSCSSSSREAGGRTEPPKYAMGRSKSETLFCVNWEERGCKFNSSRGCSQPQDSSLWKEVCVIERF